MANVYRWSTSLYENKENLSGEKLSFPTTKANTPDEQDCGNACVDLHSFLFLHDAGYQIVEYCKILSDKIDLML